MKANELRIKKPVNLIEIEKLLNISYMNVEGNGFSDENDVENYKADWRKRIGYTK